MRASAVFERGSAPLELSPPGAEGLLDLMNLSSWGRTPEVGSSPTTMTHGFQRPFSLWRVEPEEGRALLGPQD